MKKIISPLILIFLLAFCALTLASCGEQLNAPSGFVLDEETITLKWNAVKGAKSYTVSISGQERQITTKKTEVSLEKLEAGLYEISVKANGDGEVIADSEWSTYPLEREHETGLRYQLINNDTEYMLVSGGSAEGDVIMEELYRNKPVTAIKEKALYGNAKITSLKIGSNVKTIGDKAFSKCGRLESVVVPESVTSIGEYAFQSCKALTSITLPNSVTEIAPHTFAWCSSLEKVTIGNKVTKISDYAFANCEALTTVQFEEQTDDQFSVSFPDTLKTVGNYAFSDCTALPDINFGNGITSIDTYALMNCSAISKVNLGEKLLNINDYAFANCALLTSVSLPNSTSKLGNGVFFGCSELSNVSLGQGLTSVGYYNFNGTKLLDTDEKALIVDGWLIQVLDTTMEKLTIRNGVYGVASYATIGCDALAQIDISGVKYVCEYAFVGCKALYKASFDDSLESLGVRAFYGDKYLKDVTLGISIKEIGDYAFYGCEQLKEIEIPDSITMVGTRAFRGTSAYSTVEKSSKGTVYMDGWAVDYIPPSSLGAASVKINDGTRGIAKYTYSGKELNTVSIPDSVQYICKGAFYKSSPRMLNLPTELKYIGDYAFYFCTTTNFSGDATFSLTIPSGTEYIGRSAFYNCNYILSLTVPESVKTIEKFAFFGCANIGASVDVNVDNGDRDDEGKPIYEVVTVNGFVSLKNGLEYIGDSAFQNCTGILEITIPDTVKYLGSKAFYKCTALKSATIGSNVTSINDYTFYKCEALESFTVSEELESIGNYAFRGCIMLSKIDLKNVKSIGRYSFYGCSALSELILSGTLESIGDYSFRGCTEVKSVIIPESVEFIGKHVFYGLNNTSIYCEADSAHQNWNYYFNSSFRPVFFGCTLSEDDKYVVSIEVINNVTLLNSKAKNGISNPVRAGYTFEGWATEANSSVVAYTSENVFEAADGTVLYAVWTQQP